MISLHKIDLEYKSTALFGSTALLLSFLIGLIAGIRLNVVVLRSFLLMVVFAVIGFGICIILKKYVPEVYEIVSALAALPGAGKEDEAAADQGTVQADTGDVEGRDSEGMGETLETPSAPGASDFKELEKEGLSHYSTASGGTGSINTKTGKMGKHILESEKLAKYEPKIMAQAVRTMMSKDSE